VVPSSSGDEDGWFFCDRYSTDAELHMIELSIKDSKPSTEISIYHVVVTMYYGVLRHIILRPSCGSDRYSLRGKSGADIARIPRTTRVER
jgi:hypothetical protein